MTMTNDKLRALADALEPHGWKRVAAYLRAQADAQPVAWLYYSKHASQPFTTTCPPNTWGPNADDDRKTAVALYTHPAPAYEKTQQELDRLRAAARTESEAAMSVELPPLPNKLKLHTVMPNDYRYGYVYGYTADQMHGYARAAVNDALALAAQECDSLAHEPIGLDENTCLACADAIRALGGQR